MAENRIALILYVPAIHRGYMDLVRKYLDQGEVSVFVLGRRYLQNLGYWGKEIRALEPYDGVSLLGGVFSEPAVITVRELNRVSLELLVSNSSRIVIHSDTVLREFADKYLKGREIEWDTVFLRWDESRVYSEMPVDGVRTVSSSYHRRLMQKALNLSEKTSDWWRQVGGVLVKDRKVRFQVFNRHLPTEQTPYINGDPRDVVKAGTRSELASAIHCEQQIVAKAARQGVSLKRTHLYVTTFPCPVCAKLIACSGISRCYFRDGHASLDGQAIMESFGVVLSRVRM